MSDITAAVELAGYFTAHAVWCVAEGETLVPIYAYTTRTHESRFERLLADKLEDAVELGKARLVDNPYDGLAAVLIVDGYISLDTGKTDALIVECRTYLEGNARLVLIVPYRPASASGGFVVHRPKIRELHPFEDRQVPEIIEAFWLGVDRHVRGAKVWNEHLDESR